MDIKIVSNTADLMHVVLVTKNAQERATMNSVMDIYRLSASVNYRRELFIIQEGGGESIM